MKSKTIEGRKVTQNPERKRLWDVWGVGSQVGRVIFTGSLSEIRRALKGNAT